MIELDKDFYTKEKRDIIDEVLFDAENNKVSIFIFDEESTEEFKTLEIFLNIDNNIDFILKNKSIKEGSAIADLNIVDIEEIIEKSGIDFDYIKKSISNILLDEESQLVLNKKMHDNISNFKIENFSILRESNFLSIVGKRDIQVDKKGTTEELKETIRLYPNKEMHFEQNDGITSTKFKGAYDETKRYLNVRGFNVDVLLESLKEIKKEEVSLTDFLVNKVEGFAKKITKKLKR